MTQSARNQPSKQTNLAKCRPSRWNGSPAFKIERPNGEKASLLLPRLSPVNSSLFLIAQHEQSNLTSLNVYLKLA